MDRAIEGCGVSSKGEVSLVNEHWMNLLEIMASVIELSYLECMNLCPDINMDS